MAKRIRRILLDSSIYGAASEDEATFPVESIQYWDVVYSKALFTIFRKLEIFGCGPSKTSFQTRRTICAEN